jgi:hypothetical protein
MKVLFAILFAAVASTSAVAATVQLDNHAMDVVNVLVQNDAAYKSVLKYGNRVTSIVVDAPSGELTRYIVTVQQCARRGFETQCLGGAELVVSKIRHNSAPPHYTYETQIRRLRSAPPQR